MKITEAIEKKVKTALTPVHFELVNESEQHAHHKHHPKRENAAHNHGETHFHLLVVSEKFNNLPLIQRHRLITDLLADERALGLHALSMKTLTPHEFAKK